MNCLILLPLDYVLNSELNISSNFSAKFGRFGGVLGFFNIFKSLKEPIFNKSN